MGNSNRTTPHNFKKRAATGAMIQFGQATERTVPALVNRLRSRTGQAASSSNKTHSAIVSRLKKQ